MSNWGQRDDPSQLSSGERADHVAAELQAAFGGPASDVQRVCSLLCLLRQQFSEQAPKNWPSETVKRLWQSIIGALRVAQAPEVQVAACAAVEALGQSCSSCTDLERELSVVGDAVSCVVETLKAAGSRQVEAAAIKALLSLSGCLNCRCYYDKATQEVLGDRGAIQALLAALPRFLSEAADAAQQPQPQQQQSGTAAAERPAAEEGAQAVADIFRALHYTCLLNPTNTSRLVAEGGYPLVVQGLAAMGKDLNVQEHGAMLLAEMACTPGMTGRDVLDSIVTVANIARLQLQDKYIEVARSAVWSLGRLASHALAPATAAAAAQRPGGETATVPAPAADGDAERGAVLSQAWPLLSDPVLRVVVSMLQSCHLQDDPLVKHCLDYIAVVAAAAALHQNQNAATPARANGVTATDPPPDRNGAMGDAGAAVAAASAAPDHTADADDGVADVDADGTLIIGAAGGGGGGGTLVSLLRQAMEAVLSTARVACDIRLQAVVLRTLHVLLLRFPGCPALQLAPRQAEVLDHVVRIGAAARLTLEQQQAQQLQQHQHHHQHQQQAAQQAQQHLYASKDLFLVNLYSLTVAGALTDPSGTGAAGAAAVVAAANGGSVAAYQSHVLACLAGVVRHLSEGGGVESVTFDESPAAAAAAAYLSVGCCRYACHCCFIHDTLRGADVLAGVRAAAQLLVWCGGSEGVNAADRDGCGALHFLAAGGVAPLLATFIEAAGPGLDFLRRTRAGANALQLARVRKHVAAVQILEVATESAAKAAQDALLRELEAEGAHEAPQVVSSGPGSRRSGASAAASGAGGGRQQHHKNVSNSGSHDANSHAPVHGPSSSGPSGQQSAAESEEARRARHELERKRRAAEEEYEAALEQRRRQLEEEARQQAAEEARLIELAQAESLRMATPPPRPSLEPPPQEGVDAFARDGACGAEVGTQVSAVQAGGYMDRHQEQQQQQQQQEPYRQQAEQHGGALYAQQALEFSNQQQQHERLLHVEHQQHQQQQHQQQQQEFERLLLQHQEQQQHLQQQHQQQQQQLQQYQQLQQNQQHLDMSSSSSSQPLMPPGLAGAPAVAAAAGSVDAASLHAAAAAAAAAAMASGGPLPPSMAQILAQLAVEQQAQQQGQQQHHQQHPAQGQQQQHALLGGGVDPRSSGPRSSLSSMDEQITMLHSNTGPGAALGMRRVVSKGSFLSDGSGVSAGAVPASLAGGPPLGYTGGLAGGASAGGGFSGAYPGSFGNLLAASGPLGLQGGAMDAAGLLHNTGAAGGGGGGSGGGFLGGAGPGDASQAQGIRSMAPAAPGLGGFGGGGGGLHPPGSGARVTAGGGDGSVCSDTHTGSIDGMPLPTGPHGSAATAAAVQQMSMQHVSSWPGGSPPYGGGPAAFINSTLGVAGAAAPPPGLQRGGPSSNFLSQQAAAPPAPPASHLQQLPLGQLPQASPPPPISREPSSSWLGGPPQPPVVQPMSGRSSHADLHNLGAVAAADPAAAAAAAARHRFMPGLSSGGAGASVAPGMQPSAGSPSAGDHGVPLHDALAASGGEMWDLTEEQTRGSSRQLWLGNVHAGLPPGHLQALCQQFGPVQDAMVAPGTLSAVVLFARSEDAARAAHMLHGRSIPQLSYEGKPLVVRYCGAGPAGPHGDAGSAATAPAAGGATGDSGLLGLGLPTGLEAALSAAGFGPGALEAAMQGLLPPEQQQTLHAVLLQASVAAAATAGDAGIGSRASSSAPQQSPSQLQPPQPQQQQQQRGGLGGFGHLHPSHGSMTHLAGLAGSVGDFTALHQGPSSALGPFGADPQAAGAAAAGGAGLFGTQEDGGGGAVSSGGAGGGGAAGGSSTGGGGSTSGELEAGGSMGLDGDGAVDVPEGKPSRHLWLGNIPLKPNKLAMELLFARFGPLESVRVFPGKTFAFVNYLAPQHAVAAKMALDGQPAPSVTGSKPMVIRYQKDTSTVPANLGMAGGKSMSRSSSAQNLTGLTAAASLARLLDDDLPPEPAVNLSNKLNPNNIHYDRELAARYKRMSKAEKEALWAQDRAMQALGANAAAAAAAVNAGAAGIAGLLDPTNAAAARLLAQAGLGNLAAGLGGAGGGSDFLLPRVMSASALDYLAASSGHGASAAPAVGGGGGHGGLFRVNTTQSLLGMQQAANAAMLLPQMGAAGGLHGLLGQHGAAAAQALQHQLQAAQQQAALQQQLQQQQAALQQQLQQLAAAGGGGGQALLNNLAVTQALANLGLSGGAAGPSAAAAAAAARGASAAASGGAGGAGGGSGLDWASMQAALANLGLSGAGAGGGSGQSQQNAAFAALMQQQQQQQQQQNQVRPQVAAAAAAAAAVAVQQQQRLQQQQQQQQQLSAAAGAGVTNAALAAAVANAFGGADAAGSPAAAAAASAGAPGGLGGLHGAGKRLPQPPHGRMMAVGGQSGLNPGLAGAGLNPLMDPAAAAALVGGLQGLAGGPAGAAGLPATARPPGMGTFKQIPPSFLCPLTRQLMSDPVVAADGVTYNRPAIADWLRQHDASPVTRQPLGNKMLTPNVALRNAIIAELGFLAGPA